MSYFSSQLHANSMKPYLSYLQNNFSNLSAAENHTSEQITEGVVDSNESPAQKKNTFR